MAATGSLRKDPLTENLAPLFAMQRTLMMHSEVPAAFPLCVQLLAREFPGSEVLACFAEDPREVMSIRAAAPDYLKDEHAPRPIRLGSYPCGLALEQEKLVCLTIAGKGRCIEAPIFEGQKTAGALSLLIPEGLSGIAKGSRDGQRTRTKLVPEPLLTRAEDLVRWSCFLIEEALSLRAVLADRAGREEEGIAARRQAGPLSVQRQGCRTLRSGQLRGPAGEPDRKRTLRPRKGSLHRRRGEPAGPLRGSQGRKPLFGRDRRSFADGPGQAAAHTPGAQLRAGGRQQES